MVNKIAQYKVFSTQILLSEKDKIYTAFEADGKLWQFTCMPFGITNGSAVFQRKMDILVVDHELDDTLPFVGNITICGHEEKFVFYLNTIDLLGYYISQFYQT